MNFLKNNIVGLVAIVIAIAGLYLPLASAVSNSFGGTTTYDEVDATAVKIGGSNGSRIGPVIAGTCNLTGMDVSQAASSTASYDCAVTGVVSGDTVFAQLATSTQNTSVLTWNVASAHASTTSGFITVRVSNFSGTAATPSATAVGSSTQFLVLHPRSTVPGL